MKAIVQKAYGSPEVLELEEVAAPRIRKGDDVLVRSEATALHAGDVFCMRGVPWGVRLAVGFPKPKKGYVPGYDVAGRVEAVGDGVTRLEPGDEVFGAVSGGGCAEYACAKEETLVAKPAEISFEEAASVPTSALAALHGLRDAGKVQRGQKVLINGASGGVGHFAVQIAKSLGAEVTGVCSSRNVELVRSIGADRVIDYTEQDFAEGDERYDLILDNVASRTFSEYRRVLKPEGKVLPNSGHAGMGYVLKAMLRSAFDRQQGRPYLSVPSRADLLALKELLESEELAPVIDKTVPLAEAPAALAYLAEGHARGKVVVTL